MTILIKHTGERLVIEQSLETLDKELDSQVFLRISRKYIVSLNSISKIHQSFNGQLKVELTPVTEGAISISRDRSNLLKRWLGQHDR